MTRTTLHCREGPQMEDQTRRATVLSASQSHNWSALLPFQTRHVARGTSRGPLFPAYSVCLLFCSNLAGTVICCTAANGLPLHARTRYYRRWSTRAQAIAAAPRFWSGASKPHCLPITADVSSRGLGLSPLPFIYTWSDFISSYVVSPVIICGYHITL